MASRFHEQVTARVEGRQREAVGLAARLRGMTVSAWARRALVLQAAEDLRRLADESAMSVP